MTPQERREQMEAKIRQRQIEGWHTEWVTRDNTRALMLRRKPGFRQVLWTVLTLGMYRNLERMVITSDDDDGLDEFALHPLVVGWRR